MGASRPPHSIADTPRGGPVHSTPAPARWQGLGSHHSGSDPQWARAASRSSHARAGPALDPRADSPRHRDLWAVPMAHGQRGERGTGREGQGPSPSLHCPLSCPCWPSGSPQRTSESRPGCAHGAWRRAAGTTRQRSITMGVRLERGRGGGLHPPPMECGERWAPSALANMRGGATGDRREMRKEGLKTTSSSTVVLLLLVVVVFLLATCKL